MKTAFLFPGQGSQKVGMLHDLSLRYESVRKILQKADQVLGFSISKLMFEGPDSELMKTEFTQPAILTASVACWTVLKEQGVIPDMAAGHSLGEYSALVAAGAMTFEDAVYTVHMRGKFMQEAVPIGQGGMAAIMGLDPASIESICREISGDAGPVQAVNFNCPGQVVIAGETQAVQKACKKIKEAGARRAIMLRVSAPFHSTLMEPAAMKLKTILDKIKIKNAAVPVVSNYTAQFETDAAQIKHNLVMQAAHPVLWENSVKTMIQGGMTTALECGPGTVLTGFTHRIDKKISSVHVEDEESLQEASQFIKETQP